MNTRVRTDVVMFAGPTLAASHIGRALAAKRGVRIRPPIKRRDLPAFFAKVGRSKPGVICIVDGMFHDTLAVGHAEIREALDRGFRVWGLSSMGAIRAREMQALGMRGYGRVFDYFNGKEDFQDDEVALLHEPTRPYRSISEPLVHLREALDYLVSRGLVKERVSATVVGVLKKRWYGDRSIPAMLEDLKSHGVDVTTVRRELGDFGRFRLKTRDLESFLESAPWH